MRRILWMLAVVLAALWALAPLARDRLGAAVTQAKRMHQL